eukprot:scaffold60895_cov63-Phaeocystis_antarctica.AAC.4
MENLTLTGVGSSGVGSSNAARSRPIRRRPRPARRRPRRRRPCSKYTQTPVRAAQPGAVLAMGTGGPARRTAVATVQAGGVDGSELGLAPIRAAARQPRPSSRWPSTGSLTGAQRLGLD